MAGTCTDGELLMDLYHFNGPLSALLGWYGVKRETLDGYTALAKSGASVDQLLSYSEKNGLGIPREDAERTVASVAAAKSGE
jgi:hypothetical protein